MGNAGCESCWEWGINCVGWDPQVATVAPWDGKDGQQVVEEEFSLDDLMGGDL